MNYLDGKGVVFGNGASAAVATIDSAGNINTNGAFSQAGVAFKGVVAGGTCLNGRTSVWDPRTSVYGGATCSGYTGGYGGSACPGGAGFAQVSCPAGTTKIVTFQMSNCGDGGEGAICIR